MSINGQGINAGSVNEAAALDQEAFELWLRDPSAKIAHLVEIDYNGDSAVYPNWVKRTLKYSDTDVTEIFLGYKDRIASIGSFSREIGERFTGVVSSSYGEITLHNDDGELDLIPNLSIDGQEVRVLYGDPTWPLERYRIRFKCLAEKCTGSDSEKITIQLRGVDFGADLPIQTTMIPDSSGANAESNQPVPLTFGSVFNITPVCIDSTNQIHQYHGGAATSPTVVRDSGVTFAVHMYPNYITISAVDAGTNTISTATAHGFYEDTRVFYNVLGPSPPAPLSKGVYYYVLAAGLTTTAYRLGLTPGGAEIDLTNTTAGAWTTGYHWYDDLTTGKIYLDSAPDGVLTMDVTNTSTTDAATIVISALGAVNVDAASKARFQAICPQTMGIYVKDRRNRLEVARDIVDGIGAWYGYSREGMLQFGRVEGNPASYDLAITDEDMVPDSFVRLENLKPEKKHRLSYRKNWTNQKDSLATGSAYDIFGDYWRQLYSTDYSVTAPQTSTDVGTNGMFHALSAIPDVQETMMVNLADASAEAIRLDAMYFSWGAIYQVGLHLIGTLINPGMVINVTHARHGCSLGVNMTAISVEDKPGSDQDSDIVTVKFFVATSAYAPGQL